jgi:cytoskeletal protein CcmA (bactofilin family)
VCKGKITGDIAAKDRVKLRAPAVFNGSMKTPMLSIEDGVLFNGGLEMSHGVRDGATLHPVAMTPSPGVKLAG